MIVKKFGLTYLTQPPLTQFLGPWFKDIPGTKYSKRLAREKDLTEELLRNLPKYDVFGQNFSPNVINWLPWYWNNFKQTTRYTYRINDLSDLDNVWKGMEPKIRTDIRKAQKIGVFVQETSDIEQFWETHKKTFFKTRKRTSV